MADNGASAPSMIKLGWRGRASNHPIRTKVIQLAAKRTDLFDISDASVIEAGHLTLSEQALLK